MLSKPSKPLPHSSLSTVPGSPARPGSSLDVARPKTPGTPGRSRSKSPMPVGSADDIPMMDVSRVDPEEVLVDAGNVSGDLGDVSADIEVNDLDTAAEDKVLVSIRYNSPLTLILSLLLICLQRIRPSSTTAWTSTSNKLKLASSTTPSKTPASTEYTYDNVLTGSENKPVYNKVAKSHVCAAMDGYNSVIFAYGQTASGKTFTLVCSFLPSSLDLLIYLLCQSGDQEEPGIIPRAMKDVFAYIKRTPAREYLLRCSYLEIYNEAIHDLLS